MNHFRFLFGVVLVEMILWHTDKLSQTLQQPNISMVEGHGIAHCWQWKHFKPSGLQLILAETWTDKKPVTNVDKPQLPRKRKVPKRYEYGTRLQLSFAYQ